MKVETKNRKKAMAGFRQMTNEQQRRQQMHEIIQEGTRALNEVSLELGRQLAEFIGSRQAGQRIFGGDLCQLDCRVDQFRDAFGRKIAAVGRSRALAKEHPHPRSYGTFPRILRKYVREEHKLSLEDAIRKMSALAAQRMRLTDRGVLKTGMWADVVIFDPASVRDVASFENPNQLSQVMQYVMVNGQLVLDEAALTPARPGRPLLRSPLR